MSGIDINQIISKPGSERSILSIILNNNDKIVECESNNLFAKHFSVPGIRLSILLSVIFTVEKI